MDSLLTDLNDWYVEHEDPWTIDLSLIDVLRTYERDEVNDLRLYLIGIVQDTSPFIDWLLEVVENYLVVYC